MPSGRREKAFFPEEYGSFRLVRTHGRIFGLPRAVDPEGALDIGSVIRHPAVLSAATLPELQARIDTFDEKSVRPEVVGGGQGYDVVRLGAALYGVPRTARPGDLHLAEERRRVGAIPLNSPADLEEAVRQVRARTPVEFAGWLPIYEASGNCGKHPQFLHTSEPPPGYRFTCSSPPRRRPSLWARAGTKMLKAVGGALAGLAALGRVLVAFVRPRRDIGLRARLRIFAALVRLLARLLARGCRPWPVLRFLQSRHLQSQLLLGEQRGPVFLTSMPYTFGQQPWVIEIEDPTTLFFPMIQNGHTYHLDIAASPYLPIVRALLEDDSCKAILTHMQSTARMVGALFDSQTIRRKIIHAPLGASLPARWQTHERQADDEPIHLLFINSWHQMPGNFYVRGGLDVLEAFATLRERYPQLRLTLRTALPPLDDHYHRILESGWVRIINRVLPAEEMAELHASSHIFLLPAARVHIVSLLQAMAHGLAVVTSDGWGMEEYVTHERNALVVKGRYGKVSWADEQAGLLREDYGPMYTADPEVVEGIVEAVSRLVEDRLLRRRLGRTARQDVGAHFNLNRWNQGVKQALDLALAGTGTALDEASVERTTEVAAWR